MGILIDGCWSTQWYDTKSTGGAFQRQESTFRHWIRADGSSPYPPEIGRYHLYVSLACPWAHRTLILRKLKGLENAISVSTVAALMLDEGWEFDAPGDPLTGVRHLRDVYLRVDPNMTGRVTVPLLWDKKTETIVSNESSDIMRMFNAEFGALAQGPDYYPVPLRDEIDEVNAFVYETINNGVYRVGFATSQQAYEQAFDSLFVGLNQMEQRLEGRRYLLGDDPTEADWRLFTTLVRFDAVYFGHFKCNLRRIADYPNLRRFVQDLAKIPGVAETIHIDQIKLHYYGSHKTINPNGIIPKGPNVTFQTARSDRSFSL